MRIASASCRRWLEREVLDLIQLLSLQHFTEPPPRFTEASLVKEMERLGIGAIDLRADDLDDH